MQVYDLKFAESTLLSALFVQVSRKKITSKTPKLVQLYYCSPCEHLTN